MAQRWPNWIAGLAVSDPLHGASVTLYYLAIIAALIVLYGKGDFSTPGFIYQGF